MLHLRAGRAGVAYDDMEEFWADAAAAYRAAIAAFAQAGCTYLQLDDVAFAYLCDPKIREAAKGRGLDPDHLPRDYAKLINAAIASRPPTMTVCIHLCRGNFRSAWAAEGGYEPVAEVLFNELRVDGYFLEYDDARAGDFKPLRHVPKNKTVVLGLVTTKLDRMESKDDLKRRIDEAAKFMAVEQMCVSPQCGFSSTVHGNEIHVETQAAKLRLCVDTARDVWGGV
jgi:5-methyltetrahydropteroyltriglutamate--homocysteine methyltransferase